MSDCLTEFKCLIMLNPWFITNFEQLSATQSLIPTVPTHPICSRYGIFTNVYPICMTQSCSSTQKKTAPWFASGHHFWDYHALTFSNMFFFSAQVLRFSPHPSQPGDEVFLRPRFLRTLRAGAATTDPAIPKRDQRLPAEERGEVGLGLGESGRLAVAEELTLGRTSHDFLRFFIGFSRIFLDFHGFYRISRRNMKGT